MPAMKYEIRRKCPICGVVFRIKTIDSVYCSPACSKVACKRKADREAHEKKLDELAKEIPDIRELLSVKEAAAIYAVEESALYRMIRLGRIPSVSLGKKTLRIRREDLDALYPTRKKVRKEAAKPIPKTFSLEPKDCYTIGEVGDKYRLDDSSVYKHIRKYSIPMRQMGNNVYVPKKEIDNLYKSIKK